MDEDDFFSSKPQDPLTLLVKQDLGPLSVDELQARIEALRAKSPGSSAYGRQSTRHRSAADELFKK